MHTINHVSLLPDSGCHMASCLLPCCHAFPAKMHCIPWNLGVATLAVTLPLQVFPPLSFPLPTNLSILAGARTRDSYPRTPTGKAGSGPLGHRKLMKSLHVCRCACLETRILSSSQIYNCQRGIRPRKGPRRLLKQYFTSRPGHASIWKTSVSS